MSTTRHDRMITGRQLDLTQAIYAEDRLHVIWTQRGATIAYPIYRIVRVLGYVSKTRRYRVSWTREDGETINYELAPNQIRILDSGKERIENEQGKEEEKKAEGKGA
jgi:hypothetical protein